MPHNSDYYLIGGANTAFGQYPVAYDGHYYLVSDSASNWTAAYAAAHYEITVYGDYYKGHLAVINSPEENAFVYGLLSGNVGRGWIGGLQLDNQDEVDEGWQWVTGETMSYTNWDPAKTDSPIPSPNDAGGPDSGNYYWGYPYFGYEDNGENCTEMRGSGWWDDRNCSTTTLHYVIEFEPPVADLIADGGDNPTDIGDLHVRYMNGIFNIAFNVEAPWEIIETHVYIDDEAVPKESSPGRFPYSAGDITFNTDENSVYIAAHAEVRMQTGEDADGNPVYVYESAWAQAGGTDDTPIGKGKNWATFFEYQLPEE